MHFATANLSGDVKKLRELLVAITVLDAADRVYRGTEEEGAWYNQLFVDFRVMCKIDGVDTACHAHKWTASGAQIVLSYAYCSQSVVYFICNVDADSQTVALHPFKQEPYDMAAEVALIDSLMPNG